MTQHIKNEITRALEQLKLATDGVSEDDDLFETIIYDSLIFVRLVVDIQKRLDVDLLGDIDELANYKTINSMAAYIEEQQCRDPS